MAQAAVAIPSSTMALISLDALRPSRSVDLLSLKTLSLAVVLIEELRWLQSKRSGEPGKDITPAVIMANG